jgi:predicted nucleotidyltransferase
MSAEEIILTVKERLLKSKAKKYLLKIILFGSHAKGEATKDSDIDLLIVRKNGKKVEEILNTALYNILLDNYAPIEVLISPIEEILWPDSYFIYNILSYGKEVFSMDKETLKKEALTGLMELSNEYLISAEDSAGSGHWRLATDAAYNAVELITKALLLKKLDDLPGSHGGIVNKFSELYVKTKEVPYSIGRSLHNALQLRNRARYKWEAKINKNEYEDVHSLVKELTTIAEELLNK